jgi:hypothetical protein
LIFDAERLSGALVSGDELIWRYWGQTVSFRTVVEVLERLETPSVAPP